MGRDTLVPRILHMVVYSFPERRRWTTTQEWRTRAQGRIPGYGQPTPENIRKHVEAFERSTQPGGVNAHVGAQQVTEAWVIDQKTGQKLGAWKRPAFEIVGGGGARTMSERERQEHLTRVSRAGDAAERRVRELARTAAYHKGPAMTYHDVAKHCPSHYTPHFIARQCELAGFPVWTSAPEEAITDSRARKAHKSGGGAAMTLHRPPGSIKMPDNDQWTNRFQVKSESSNRLYTVAQNKKKRHWACSCPGYLTKRNCKHLKNMGLPCFEQPHEVLLK